MLFSKLESMMLGAIRRAGFRGAKVRVHALKSGDTFEIDMASVADAVVFEGMLRTAKYDVMRTGAGMFARPSK